MELTTEQRLARLEALVDILLEERKILRERLAAVATTSMVEKQNDNLIQGRQYHPDGDFNKPTIAPSGNLTETDDSDKDLSKNEEYIDLGLPSGIKWAKCNVGANSEEEYGNYYTFDEAVELFKNRDDRMPSKADFEELLENTQQIATDVDGVEGIRFTSETNGNSFFIPLGGFKTNHMLYGIDMYTYLWASTSGDDSNDAWCLECDYDNRVQIVLVSKIIHDFTLRTIKD